MMKRALHAFSISLLIGVSLASIGCSMRESRMVEAGMELPSTYSTGLDGNVVKSELWWKTLGDSELENIIDEALRNNPGLDAAYARVNQAEAAARSAGAARWPQLNVSGSAGRQRQSFGVSGSGLGLTSNTSDSYSLSASASYEIDLWRRLDRRANASRLDAAAAHKDLETIYIRLSATVADLYYLAIEQRSQLELSESTIAAFKDTLDRVERRYRAGLVSALDVYQSRQNLAQSRSLPPIYRDSLARTENALSVALGQPPAGDTRMHAESHELPVTLEMPAGVPADILMNRPDVESALLRLEAFDNRAAAALADRFPTFSLAGAYGGASMTLSEVLDSPNIFWNIFIQAVQPVIDGGRRKAEAERAEAAFDEALANYKNAVLNALREVEDALSAVRASSERISVLEERVEASDGALRLSLDRYFQGISDYLPVLDAQRRSYEAKSTLISARREMISNRITLARALGGRWPVEMIEQKLASDNSGKESGK